MTVGDRRTHSRVESKFSEASLHRLRAAIVESAPFGILLVNAHGRIVFANHGSEILSGYTRDELEAMDVDSLVPAARRAAHQSLRETYFSQPAQRPMASGRALAALRKDGREVPVEVALKPIEFHGVAYVLGVVVDITERRCLEDSLKRAHDDLELRVQQRTAELAAANAEKERLLIDLQAKTRDLERLSLEDPLTGLSNRRDFDRHLQAWIGHARRHHSALSLAIFDIDNFKRVNDEYGHAQGDEVLKQTADLMRRECRAIDVVARYGGEEFALILPHADVAGAAAICERIRREFANSHWGPCAPSLRLTISAGVASWDDRLESHSLLGLADQRLYSAKRAGRNRVVAVDDPMPAAALP